MLYYLQWMLFNKLEIMTLHFSPVICLHTTKQKQLRFRSTSIIPHRETIEKTHASRPTCSNYPSRGHCNYSSIFKQDFKNLFARRLECSIEMSHHQYRSLLIQFNRLSNSTGYQITSAIDFFNYSAMDVQ